MNHEDGYKPAVRRLLSGSRAGTGQNANPIAVTAGDPRSLIAILEGMEAMIAGTEWMDQGLCAQTDPEAFFPEQGGSTSEAKAVCRSCEVRAECLDYALENDEHYGIWGGLSERERRRIKRPAA